MFRGLVFFHYLIEFQDSFSFQVLLSINIKGDNEAECVLFEW